MAWVESESLSFRARHGSTHADDADRVLHSLERTREYLGQYFPRTVDGISVVFHPSVLSLTLARPLMPLAWLAASPAARRYVAGWCGPHELHVLLPDALGGARLDRFRLEADAGPGRARALRPSGDP